MSWIIQAIAGYPTASSSKTTLNTKCINLDWSTEYLLNSTNQSIWIANTWTIWMWVNFTSFNWIYTLFWISDWVSWASSVNLIQWLIFESRSNRTYLKIIDSSNYWQAKQYTWDPALSTWTNYFLVFTWDWTNLKHYNNWTERSTTNIDQDAAVTQTEYSRKVAFWDVRWLANEPWKYSTAYVWDKALPSSEITAMYDSWNWFNIDARYNFWNYVSKDNLKHQWALWYDSSLTQSDYVSSWWINVYTNMANITSWDIENF